MVAVSNRRKRGASVRRLADRQIHRRHSRDLTQAVFTVDQCDSRAFTDNKRLRLSVEPAGSNPIGIDLQANDPVRIHTAQIREN